jgi:antitoxin component YwqK of YwqJK toxin-antitoxin module
MSDLQEQAFESAEEKVLAYSIATHTKYLSAYRIDSIQIGQILWDEAGRIVTKWEMQDGILHGWNRGWYYDESGSAMLEHEQEWQHGLLHGVARLYHENGQLLHETHYADGLEHGMSRQFDPTGTLIGTYQMVRGTGIDRWYADSGVLTEERHYVNGQRHGYERWYYCGCEGQLFEEGYYWEGESHGILRQWNDKGRLGRGFPKYFVKGQSVTKRQYLARAKQDTTLPPFQVEDNQPYRH